LEILSKYFSEFFKTAILDLVVFKTTDRSFGKKKYRSVVIVYSELDNLLPFGKKGILIGTLEKPPLNFAKALPLVQTPKKKLRSGFQM
jgi:hypothetical protein